ncbi:flagellar biosynthetic protein FliR [Rhizorhapis suberifaciens]|uniref:Flagellar biosynthetic protein FliR n=1 Tax=Rhizorhapis suberifaciens TaxID=13656 RepID=A0A840HY50_9SPHN|nr:flagellar biosynthetic protein FliR [Rhizorhapis suberifaciens]MBB4642480.1 flagellar biosynthetic protein FliR [Rhizorhapis suberifaciens]
MIAPGLAGVEAQLWLWLVAMIRPGAAFLAAPIYGTRSVPVQLRLILSLALGMAALNSVTITIPQGGIATFQGIMLVAGEVLAGLAMGFALQIGYSAAFVAGEVISNAMGLGFASMSDPQSGQSSPVIGTFLSVLATFLLLAMDGHLMLIGFIVKSYQAIPPGVMMSNDAIYSLVMFGGTLFGAGLTIALPVGFALILIQLVMAMLARSAPSLNLFSVGMPAAIICGLVLLAMAAPVMSDAITEALRLGLDHAQSIAEGRGG